MTTINERFNILIEALHQNVRSFAQAIDKSYSAVENTCKGRTKPGYDVLDAVLRTYPQVSPDWLMKGEGEMFKAQQVTPPTQQDGYLLELLKKMEQGFSRLTSQVEVKDQQIASLQRILEATLLPGKSDDVVSDRSGYCKHPAVGRFFAQRQEVA